MNPLWDVFTIEDKTTRSCEPNSLMAVNSAIRDLSYKIPHSRMKISHVEVEAGEITEDGEYPGNYDRTFTVKIGFHIKTGWYFSEIRVKYHYAPEACISANIKTIKLGKQVGEYPNLKFEEVNKK